MKYTVIIKENKDFLNAYKRGGYSAGRAVTVYYRRNGRGKKRLGITTGKKVGNAVVRSRCRRIIRAAYRENEELFPRGFDYVIVARPGCGNCKSTQISSFLKNKALPSIIKSMGKKPEGGRSSERDKK